MNAPSGASEGRSVGKCAAAWQGFERRSGTVAHHSANRAILRRRGSASRRLPYAGIVASIARNGSVGATALTTTHFLLLYCAMLVASSGNTALQSVMPAIGREIGIDDFYVAIAYTWSAVLWVLLAPYWAEKSDHHGRKTLTMMGVSGFIVSMTAVRHRACSRASWLDRRRADLRPVRCVPCESTAASAARPLRRPRPISRRRRGAAGASRHLSALSSSFGLGTIIGPAVAPLFVLPVVGLAGPLFAFALIARAVVISIVLWLPNDRAGRRTGHGAAMSYPSLASSADRRQRHRGDRAAPAETAELERPAHPPVDRRWSRRRPCPGGDPDLHRLLHHRSAAPCALGFRRTDRDRDDGRRGRDARRAMGTDPASRAQPARADPVGRADRGGGPLGTMLSNDLYGITIGFAVAIAGLWLHSAGIYCRRFARGSLGRAGRGRRRDHRRRTGSAMCSRRRSASASMAGTTICRSPPWRCCWSFSPWSAAGALAA